MKQNKLNILFFYVHPAKFHLFKNTINLLENNGHKVDIAISNKEVLSSLLDNAGVKYKNLFPKGRKINFLPTKINAIMSLIATLWKLWFITRKKKYDLYVTDDVLSILGKIQGVPSIAFTDNDLITIPLIKLIFKSASKIIAPTSTDLGDLEYKKIPFKGNKAIAHLSPVYFKKDVELLTKYNLQNKQIFLIRLAKLNANHDVHGNPGITDNDLDELFKLIPEKYSVLISSERVLPEKYKKYLLNIPSYDFNQVLAHSYFFIGDSGTMATEAAVLGVPNILINNIAKKCGVHVELSEKYHLQKYFDNFPSCIDIFEKLLKDKKTPIEFENNKIKLLNNSDDFNQILFNSIINFPFKK